MPRRLAPISYICRAMGLGTMGYTLRAGGRGGLGGARGGALVVVWVHVSWTVVMKESWMR